MTQEEHDDTQQASQEPCVRSSLDNLKGLEGEGDKGNHFFTDCSVRGTAS